MLADSTGDKAVERAARSPLARTREATGRAARRHGARALLIVVVSILAWPFLSLTPGVEADWNWVAGLAIAAKDGMAFGDGIVWTYGPLGFLENVFGPRLYYGDVAIVSVGFQAIVQVLLVGTVYLAARRSYPAVIAALIAFVVVCIVPDRVFALGAAWSMLLVLTREDERVTTLTRWAPAALGVLCGVMALGKLNYGLALGLMAVIALATRAARRRLDALTFAAALTVTAAAGWFGTGQSLSGVWPYLRGGRELISGYAAAMGYDSPDRVWMYWAAAAVFAFGLTLVWRAGAGAQPLRRAGLVALWAVASFVCFKAGFTRWVGGNATMFFGNLLVLLAIVPVAVSARALGLTTLVSVAVLVGAAFGPYRFDIVLSPRIHVDAVRAQVSELSGGDTRGAAKSRLRDQIAATYAVPAPVLQEIAGRSTAGWPQSFGSIAYAYELDWQPLPLLDLYSVYTPQLDELGAERLGGDDAPERVLRRLEPPVDGRHSSFDAPATTRALLCRYRPVVAAEPWQVLARGADRCGSARVVERVRARWGEPVEVPRPSRRGALVQVRIDGAGVEGLERLKELWLRPAERTISLDGSPFRLIAATAVDGLIMSIPAGADYPAPFALAPNPATISVAREGSQPSGLLDYTFEEIQIAPLPTKEQE